MSAKTARMIIAICDWMMGYHGKLIEDAIYSVLLAVAAFIAFAYIFILYS